MVSRLLIGAVLLYIGILIVAPVGAIVHGAFSRGLGAFLAALNQPDVFHAFQLTLILSAAAVTLNTVFGVLIAWMLVRHRFRGRGLVNGLVDLPFVVSPVIAGYAILLLFGRQGWFAPFVQVTGIRVAFALPGMLLATLFISLPFVIREVMPVLESVGTEQEQMAHTLGASGWQTFWRVTLPNIRWGVLYGITLTLARTLGEFGAVLVVSGAVSGLTETATLYIFRAMDERQYLSAYAVSVVLGAISFGILMAMEGVKRRLAEERRLGTDNRRRRMALP
ncbi:MAG: sulfate ABC transporter permease subunit [Caldilineales bacterium]|nr:sulfate ABC transporter permease subunit [Caldilineales bacterium]